jgi:ribose 1,5-bisphosphokinase PhnN
MSIKVKQKILRKKYHQKQRENQKNINWTLQPLRFCKCPFKKQLIVGSQHTNDK